MLAWNVTCISHTYTNLVGLERHAGMYFQLPLAKLRQLGSRWVHFPVYFNLLSYQLSLARAMNNLACHSLATAGVTCDINEFVSCLWLLLHPFWGSLSVPCDRRKAIHSDAKILRTCMPRRANWSIWTKSYITAALLTHFGTQKCMLVRHPEVAWNSTIEM